MQQGLGTLLEQYDFWKSRRARWTYGKYTCELQRKRIIDALNNLQVSDVPTWFPGKKDGIHNSSAG